MKRLADVLQWVQVVEWTLIALAAGNVWRRRRTPAATWLAVTFATLALVVIAGRAIGDSGTEVTIVVRLLLAVLTLFPYLLYRFVVSMVDRKRWAWITAHILTGAVLVETFVVSSFPEPGEPRSLGFYVFLVLFLAQWGFLLTRVAWRLWRTGSGQPAVARRRTRTMALGAILLALTLVVSSVGASPDVRPVDIVVSLLGLLAAPLFFFGFDPPSFLRLWWRQREEADLRATEVGLVRAVSRSDVASAWLPRVSALVGGEGAVLFDVDGSVLAVHNFDAAEIDDARRLRPDDVNSRYETVDHGSRRVLSMHNGWLVVSVGPLTPFFGDDELRVLASSSVLADLALGRARLFELEREAGEAMRDFIAIASHDLRTPVTVISGFTELMQQQWDALVDAKKLEFLGAITRQVLHLDRLIGDLLTVSRLDVRELEVFVETVDLGQLTHNVVGELGIDATVEVRAANGIARARVDPDHAARMVRNYLTNAQSYGAPPYSITVTSDDDVVTVAVKDGGAGVPDAFVARLFQKFARVDKKKSRAVQGTGLGLSIVRGLAQNNGGDAWYEHNVPKGAVFCFRVPAASPDEIVEAKHA